MFQTVVSIPTLHGSRHHGPLMINSKRTVPLRLLVVLDLHHNGPYSHPILHITFRHPNSSSLFFGHVVYMYNTKK